MTLTTWTDEFDDESLDSAKWGTSTANSGTVSESGGQVVVDAPATNDAAVLYWKDQVQDSGYWQVYEARVTPSSVSTGGNVRLLAVMDTIANLTGANTAVNPDGRIYVFFIDGIGIRVQYVAESTSNYWTGSAWSTTPTNFFADTTQGHTYIVRLRVRPGQWLVEIANGAGTSLIGCTDWVDFSSLKSYTSLWVAHGEPYNNFTDGVVALDNASYQQQDTTADVQRGVYNGTDGTGYQIGTCYSLDTFRWYRQQQGPTLSQPSGHSDVKDGYARDVSGTLTMLYSALNTAGSDWRIRYATSADDGDSWADQGEIIAKSGSGWRQNGCQFPVWYHDGSTYHVYTGGYNGSSQLQLGYFTGAALGSLSEGSNNPVVALGSGGAYDDNGVLAFHFHLSGSQKQLVGGGNDGANWQASRWQSSDFDDNFAAVGSPPEIPRASGNSTTLDAVASAGATTLSVNDESPFTAGDPIVISQGAGNVEVNRVKSVAAGQLTLWSPLVHSYASTDLVALYDQGSVIFSTTGDAHAIVTSFQWGAGSPETLSLWESDGMGGWTLLPSQTPPLEIGGLPTGSRWDKISSENLEAFAPGLFHSEPEAGSSGRSRLLMGVG